MCLLYYMQYATICMGNPPIITIIIGALALESRHKRECGPFPYRGLSGCRNGEVPCLLVGVRKNIRPLKLHTKNSRGQPANPRSSKNGH